MTIEKVLEQLGRLKPNTVYDEDVARWLLELDGQLFHELRMPAQLDRPLRWPEDQSKTLVAAAPYDGLYLLYAQAKIEFSQREYGSIQYCGARIPQGIQAGTYAGA